MKRGLCILVLLMMILLISFGNPSIYVYAEEEGPIYWVSPNGQAARWADARHDTAPDITDTTKYASITMANSNAVAGDTIYIRGGTYVGDEFINPKKSGTSWDNQIVYSAYNNETVIMTSQLCPNRSHESGAWTAINGAVVTHSTEEAFDGDYSTKFTVSGGLQGIRSDSISFQTSAGYMFTAWVWSEQSSINVCINKGDGSGLVFEENFAIEPGRWNLVKKTGLSCVAGEYSYIAFRSPAGSTSGTWYVDNVRIHKNQPAVSLSNKDYIKVHGIDFIACKQGLVMKNGADYNEISHCSFADMNVEMYYSSNIISHGGGLPCTHNWIHHCSFYENGVVKNGDDIGSGFRLGSDSADESGYNLIEYCVFRHAAHDLMNITTRYNTIRNNWFRNDGWIKNTVYDEGGYPSAAGGYNNPLLFGGRCMAIEEHGNSGYNLVEGNRVGYAGTPPDDDGSTGISDCTDGNILRYNSIYANGAAGYGFKSLSGGKDAENNRIYNNTIVANGGGEYIDPAYHAGLLYTNPSQVGNVIKNNIVYNNEGAPYKGGSTDQLYVMNTYANNLEQDPKFVDPDMTDKSSLVLPDFTLMPNSPAIDMGVALTTVAASDSGTGTSLVVQDASYFQDGTWAPAGKIEADWIAVGSVDNVVKISSIDYATNVITLEQSISRNVSDDVWLYKNSSGDIVLQGPAPDIGAHEFFGIKENSAPMITLHTPASLQAYVTGSTVNVDITVRDDSGVAKVEYYLDNVKVGETTQEPFDFAITNIQEGFHKLYCIVYDEEGLYSQSSESTIVVGNPQPTIVNSATWVNIPFSTLDGVVTASLDIMPLQNNTIVMLGLTLGEANSYNSTAVIILLRDTNVIQAINGASYSAENVISYSEMEKYRVTVTVDLNQGVYSASVTDEEGNTQLLADDYAFRSQMAGTSELNRVVCYGGTGSFILLGYNVEQFIPAESVDIVEDNISLDFIGETRTLTASILPENATNKELEWESSDTSVATVDENGKVTAVSDGTATITVTVVGTTLTDTCSVTVSLEEIPAPLAEYTFSGNMNDTSGNGYNGTSSNPPVLTEDRQQSEDSAYDFSSGQYIDLFNNSSIGEDDFTVALWFKADEVTETSQLIGKSTDRFSIDDQGFFIGLRQINDVDRLVAQVKGTSGSKTFNISSIDGQDFDETQWHFVALVKTSTGVCLYLDGQAYLDNTIVGDCSCTNMMRLGRDALSVYFPFNGIIDDVRIYDQALTVDQLDALYTEEV